MKNIINKEHFSFDMERRQKDSVVLSDEDIHETKDPNLNVIPTDVFTMIDQQIEDEKTEYNKSKENTVVEDNSSSDSDNKEDGFDVVYNTDDDDNENYDHFDMNDDHMLTPNKLKKRLSEGTNITVNTVNTVTTANSETIDFGGPTNREMHKHNPNKFKSQNNLQIRMALEEDDRESVLVSEGGLSISPRSEITHLSTHLENSSVHSFKTKRTEESIV